MYDVIIIGGGPAGLAAADACWNSGLKKILLIERERELGGILNQCIHNGFGLDMFKEELTGPEFAGRFIEKLQETGVEVMLDTMVLEINDNKEVYVSNKDGYRCLKGKAIILAMGCRERTRGAIAIPGTRASGVFTAGTAQRYMNIDGYMVGKRVVILGSGDIGLIMARRITLEGGKVLACLELNSFAGGLPRNIQQCLKDFNIPLYLSTTVTDIQGEGRVNKVIASKVDERFRPIPGTEMEFDCDTLLLSIGLIPENELSKGCNIEIDPRSRGPKVWENMETSVEGIFACGNVVHVHDLADNVAREAAKAGQAASEYVLKHQEHEGETKVHYGKNLVYTVPQHIHRPFDRNVEIFFRARKVFGECRIEVRDEEGNVLCKYRRNYIVPGEMEKVMVPKVLLEKARGDLTVEVVE